MIRRLLPVVLLAVAGCSADRTSPIGPSGQTLSAAPTTAALTVTRFAVRPQVGRPTYLVDLELANAAGSGAWVTSVHYEGPGFYPAGCAGFRDRVGPGATGWSPPVYCLDFDAFGDVSGVSVLITFTGDDGRSGYATASTTVTR